MCSFLPLNAGVSREIEDEYEGRYENRAMFLKLPVRGERQVVFLRGEQVISDPASQGEPLLFRVGEQVRITEVRFRDSSVEFKVASIDMARRGALVFQFPDSLGHSFPRRATFDHGINESFTEGLSYQEIEAAKTEFLSDQYEAVINRLSIASGASPDQVVRTITEKSPIYQRTATEIAQLRADLETTSQKLDQEEKGRRVAEAELQDLRREVSELQRSDSTNRREKDALAVENRNLEERVDRLENENTRFQSQLEAMAGKLNVQLDSNSQLGNQVSSLSGTIDALKTEQIRLTTQLSEAEGELATLRKERDGLNRDLRSARRKSSRLQSELDSLTSNRDSLEASFLRTKRAKESMERAAALERAIRLRPLQDDEQIGRYGVFLGGHQLATIGAQVPSEIGHEAVVRFHLESPDTVEFTEEERADYESLGDPIRVKTEWRSWTEGLESTLLDGEPVQSVPPREEAVWRWSLQGGSEAVSRASLRFYLVDSDDQLIQIADQDFELLQGGLIGSIQREFSWLSLISGLLLGAVGVVTLTKLRRRPPLSRTNSSRVREEYPTQKRL
jgi:predicted  nucleic acid-binding Zn-ribbon protein